MISGAPQSSASQSFAGETRIARVAAGGTATAAFALPPGFDPTLGGLLLHHAALVLDPVQLTALVSTEAEPLVLVP